MTGIGFERPGQFALIAHKDTSWLPGPFGNQIAAILACAAFADEIGEPAPQNDLKAVAGLPFDQLAGDVDAAGPVSGARQLRIIFPIAMGGMGEGRRRCCMGDARGGDDSGRVTAGFGQFEQGFGLLAGRTRALAEQGSRTQAEHTRAVLDPRGHGGRGRR